MKKYRDCNLVVRMWRCRWKVWYSITFVPQIVRWMLHGMPQIWCAGRIGTLRIYWRVQMGRASLKMNNTITVEEAFELMRKSRSPDTKIAN